MCDYLVSSFTLLRVNSPGEFGLNRKRRISDSKEFQEADWSQPPLKGGDTHGSFCSQFGPFYLGDASAGVSLKLSVDYQFRVLGFFSFRARVFPSSRPLLFRSSVRLDPPKKKKKLISSRATMRENERTNLSEKGCWDRKVSKKKSLSLWANKFTFDDLIGSIADFRHLRFYGTRIYAILHTLPSVTVHKTILYSKSSATADYYRRTRTCYLCTLSSYSITQYKYILISLLVYFPFSSSFVEKKVKKKKERKLLTPHELI